MRRYHRSCLLTIPVFLIITMCHSGLLAASLGGIPLHMYPRYLGLPSSLKGNITLQGRSAGKMAVSFKVKLYKPGEIDPAFTYDVSANGSGEFTIENIDAGDYVVTVKNTHTLQVAKAITIVEGTETTINFGELPEGDANNDNQVTILDFSVLSQAFGSRQGSGNYQSSADFNEDNAVTILDFSLLAENFNQKGYQVKESSYNELSGGSGTGYMLDEAGMHTLAYTSSTYKIAPMGQLNFTR